MPLSNITAGPTSEDVDIARRWVLAVILVPFFIDLFSALLNRSWLSKAIPQELNGIYNEEDYQKAQDYNRAKSSFSLTSQFWGMACFQAFRWFGGFLALDTQIESFGLSTELSGCTYIFALLFANHISTLPLSIYSTFVLEASFGFNRTTPCTFVKDRLRAVALALLLGVPLLILILWIFIQCGSNAWLYVWVSIAVFQIFFLLITPKYIMPMFLQMIPLPQGTVIRIMDIKKGTDDDNKKHAFLTRIYYEMDSTYGDKKAYETKDRQYDGGSRGKKLSIFYKNGLWNIAEGDVPKDSDTETPSPYAVSTSDASSPELTDWKLCGDDGLDTPLTGPIFNMALCEVGKLRDQLADLSTKLNYITDKIFLIDGTSRSEHSNAFCIGLCGDSRQICLFDSLLGKLTNDEIVAVLGHEIGHDKLHHTKIRMVQALALAFVEFFLLGQFISNATLAQVFFMPKPKVYVGFVLFGFVWSVVEAFISIPFAIQSRCHEHQADRFSIDADSRYAEWLAKGLMKLMRNSKINLTPHPLKVFLDFSHPPLHTRLKEIGNYKKAKWNEPFAQPDLLTD